MATAPAPAKPRPAAPPMKRARNFLLSISVLLLCVGASGLVLPGGLVAGLIGEAKIHVLLKFNFLVEHSGFDHEITHQIEVWLAGREGAIHYTVQRLGKRPAQQGWVLVVVEASDKISRVFPIRFPQFQP